MNLACQPITFLDSPELDAACEELGALDGDAEHVADRVQQAQIVRGETSPFQAGHIEDAKFLALGEQGDAGVKAQPISAVYQFLEAAAGHDIDIGGALHIATAEGIEAITPSFHTSRV